MKRILKFLVVPADAFSYQADLLVLKYAQRHYGLDRAVNSKLSSAGVEIQLPEIGASTIVNTNGTLKIPRVLFMGVPPLHEFGYSEIRDFARSALVALATDRSSAKHVVFTVHGAGYGLDESEAFDSEVAGIVEAVIAGACPTELEKITFVESDPSRASRLTIALARLLPGGELELNSRKSISDLSSATQNTLRTAGYSSAAKPHVFVAMPFAPEMDDIYYYGIQGAVKAAQMLCERADLSSYVGDVTEWVKTRISTAKLVIGDLSTANPNVYLEVGYAWGCRVPTVLIAQEIDDLKFDVKSQRCIMYKSIRQLEESLGKELNGLAEHIPFLRTGGEA